MRRAIAGMAAVLLVWATACRLSAGEVDTNGVTPGKWTMDLEAAAKLAASSKRPLLLNFSGSDWCGWCQLMDRRVFSAKKWKDYAKDNLVMVVIDFPQDDEIVPPAFAKRNAELKEKYKVQGFPTFIVLDDDAQTVLGQLGAGQDKTPESFIAELQQFLRYRPVEVEKYTKPLSPADKAAYLKIVEGLAATRQAIKTQEQQITAAQKKIEELQEQGEEQEGSAMRFRAGQLGADKLKAFDETKAKMDKARKKLTDWLKTNPDRNEENAEKFKVMSSELRALADELRDY